MFAPVEDQVEAAKHIAEILSGKMLLHEVVGFDKQGTRHYVELRETAIPLPDGTMGVLSVSTDVTERKVIEEALKESEERYRLISSAAFDYIFSTRVGDDGKLHHNWVAGAFEEITGYSYEEYVEHGGWRASVYPDDYGQDDHDLEMLKSNQKTITEIRTINKKGGILWVRVYAYPIWDAERHQLSGIYGAVQDITERKQAEEALRESEEKFRYVFDSSPMGKSITFLTGEIHVSKAFSNMLGYSMEEMNNRRWPQITHPDDIALSQAQVDSVLSGEQDVARFTKRYFHTNGAVVWADVSLVCRRDAEGRPLYLLTTVNDITEHRRAEEALRESEDRFRSLYENTTLGLYRTTPEGKILLANPALVKMLGYSSLEGLTLKDLEGEGFAIPDDRKKFLDLIEKEGMVSGLESAWKDRQGKTIYVRESARAIRDARGKILYYDGTVEDVTERKKAENALIESEQQFRLISENVADMIVVLDLEGKRIYNSPSYREILGDPESLKGTDSFREIHPDDREMIKKLFMETASTGIGHQIEYRLVGKDNSVHFIESVGSVIRDVSGKITNVIVVGRDVTEKKRLEQQYFRAQRLESLGTLASGVAHDLNNVLGPIVLAIEVLKNYNTDETALTILDTLATSARRGADIVKQILGFARGMEGERTVLQPRHLVKETVRIISETFPKNIAIKADLPKETWTITGDSTQVGQVVLNLCVNARDAMPFGGTLSISIENTVIDDLYSRIHVDAKPGKYVMIKVEDTGSGISPEVLDRMFEPFYTTKERGKGTGLGLSTVHAIVKSHRGFIIVDSELGKGTTFKVHFPTEETAMADKILESHRTVFRGNGELLLVIDDEESILEITRQTLEAFNYSVITAKDGLEGIEMYKLHANEIALVITDMMMPNLDGYQTIHILRSLNKQVKIIGSSGLASDGYTHPGLTAKPDEFIMKPYNADKLLGTIAKLLKRRNDKTN
jgi:PAS domain S-box-containing protein